MNFGCPASAGFADGLRSGFFYSAGAIGMNFDDRTIQTYRLTLDANELFALQLQNTSEITGGLALPFLPFSCNSPVTMH